MAQNWNASIVELREGLDRLENQLNTLITLRERLENFGGSLEYINKIRAEIEDLQRVIDANRGLTTRAGAAGTPNSTLNERIANVNREYARALDDVATATNKADVAQARYQLRIDNLSDAIDIYYRKNQDFIAQNPELVSGLTALARALELARTEGNIGDASQDFKRFKIDVNEAQEAVRKLAKEKEAAARASAKAENEALKIRERAEKEDEKRRQQRLRDAEVYYKEQVKNLTLIEKEREKDRKAAIESYKAIAREQEREQKRIQDNLKAQALAAASEATYYATTIKNKVIDTLWRSALDLIRNIFNATKQLDSELVEIRKVTDLTEKELMGFTRDIQEIGNRTATTTTQLLEASAVFARSGFSTEQIKMLTEEAAVLKNVSDGIEDMSQSAQVLISVMKAYDIPAERARTITDQLNIISNNAAISFDDLAEGISRVGSVFASQDTSVGQLSALLTGANEILQDISKTSNGLKTISQRLRTIKGDSAKYQELISGITEKYGKIVNITDVATGQLRGTYDILKDLAAVWEDMTKNEQQLIGEQLAGKNQITVLQALLNNWAGVEKAIENVDYAVGSAAREQEAYLNSLTGAIDRLKASLENMYASVQASPLLTFFVNLANAIVKLTDFIGVIPIAIGAASGAVMGFLNRTGLKLTSLANVLGDGNTGVTGAFGSLKAIINGLKSQSVNEVTAALKETTRLTKEERIQFKNILMMQGERVSRQAQNLALSQLQNKADEETIRLLGKQVAQEQLLNSVRMIGIGLAVTGFVALISGLSKLAIKERESAIKNYNEASDKVDEIKEKIKEINDEIESSGGKKTNSQVLELEKLNKELERTTILAKEARQALNNLVEKQMTTSKGLLLDFKDESSGTNVQYSQSEILSFFDKVNEKFVVTEENYVDALKIIEGQTYQFFNGMRGSTNEYIVEALGYLDGLKEALEEYDAQRNLTVTFGITKDSVETYLVKTFNDAIDDASGDVDWGKMASSINTASVNAMVQHFGQPIETFAKRLHQINKDNIDMWQQQYSDVYAVNRELKDYVDLYSMATGDLSSSQLLNIINNWEQYVDVLVVEQGELRISKDLVLRKAKAQIESLKATIKAKIADAEQSIVSQKIELEATRQALVNAKKKIIGNNRLIESTLKYIDVKEARNKADKGEIPTIGALSAGLAKYQTRIDELNVSISNQEDYIKNLKEQLVALDKINLESLLKTASSGTSKAASATKQLNSELEKLKNLLSTLQKQMTDTTNVYEKVQAAMKDIIEAEIDALEKENDSLDDGLKYYEARVKLIEEYYDSGIAKLEEQKKAAEEANEAEQQALKDKIEALKESTKEYEEQNKAAQDAIDEQVKALEEQISAIDEANKAKEDELKVEEKLLEIEKARLAAQKAKDAYEQAKRSKTVRTYDAQRGWIYTANQGAVSSAYNEYVSAQATYNKLVEELEKMRADAAREEEKAALQRQIDELKEQKESLKELLEETKDNAETQEEEWNAQIDLLEQQKDEISEGFDKQIEELEKQSDSLTNIEDDVERMLDKYLNDEETLAWVEAYKNASDEERKSMEEALRTAWLDNRTARLGNDDTIAELKELLEKVNDMLETTDSILDSEGVKAWLESFKNGDYASRDSMIKEMRDTYLEFITAQQAEIDKVQASIDKLEGTINVTNDLLRYWGTGKSHTPVNNYANGGVVNSGLLTQTGMLSDRVKVHGTPTNPEVILNGRQQANLLYQLARQNPSVVNSATNSSSSSMYIANLNIQADSQDTLHNLLLQARQLAFVGI